jgi:hypothetical protein
MAIGLTRDVKIGLLIGVLVILAVIVLAFVIDYHLLALQGTGVVQSILGVPEAALNGIASAITGFFNWLSHFFSNLLIVPQIVV